jgi:hypothetical protein
MDGFKELKSGSACFRRSNNDSKKHQKWIRVEKVSLTDSVLGRSPTLAECREVAKNPPAVA